MEQIPFNRPVIVGREYEYIAQAIDDGWISGNGIFTKRCQALLEELVGVEKVFLTTSCTDALEMAALLCDVQPGDEVVIPSFTFVSTVNAGSADGLSMTRETSTRGCPWSEVKTPIMASTKNPKLANVK